MSRHNLKAWWYEALQIDLLDPFDVPEEKTGGIKTGGMKPAEWEPFFASVKKHGLINPIIVEDDNTSFKVAIGNNRVWAMKALGETTIKAIVITRSKVQSQMPEGGVFIPPQIFVHHLSKVHPGDDTWKKSGAALWIAKTTRQVEGTI